MKNLDLTNIEFDKLSEDSKRIINMMKPFIDFVTENIGLENIKDFCGDLKEHSKFEEDSPKKHIIKENLYPLLRKLFNDTEPKRFIPDRELKRIGYYMRNILLNYQAYEYPDAMQKVCENLETFDFYLKLHDVDVFVFKWRQKIKQIQDIKKQKQNFQNINPIYDLNPQSSNSIPEVQLNLPKNQAEVQYNVIPQLPNVSSVQNYPDESQVQSNTQEISKPIEPKKDPQLFEIYSFSDLDLNINDEYFCGQDSYFSEDFETFL